MNAFRMRCKNWHNGCDFKGNYEKLEDHEFSCVKGDDDETFCEECLEGMLYKYKESHSCVETLGVMTRKNEVSQKS